MDKILKEQIEEKDIPGLAVGVFANGKLAWSKGYGYADVENGRAVNADTAFILASISKTVTAVAAMILFEEDAFALEDDINDYLPFPIRNPNHPEEPITFQMLFTHTSSISDENANDLDEEIMYVRGQDPDLSLAKYIENYFHPEGEFYDEDTCFLKVKPGIKYEYSNSGVALLGYLVEVIAEQDFEEFCREKIFQPLGMKNTSWRLDYFEEEQISLPYVDSETTNGHYTCPDFPNGLLRSSVNDMAKFFMMFINDGSYNGVKILSKETTDLMKEVQFEYEEDGETSNTCLIWYFEGDDYIGHEGSEEGVKSSMFYDLKENVGIIAIANRSEADIEEIEQNLYDHAMEFLE
jgi:CubicO group peptidase (beta-lactamase class C family)